MFFSANAARSQTTWNTVALNGGGFHMGFSIANDGTVICRTDIAGAYKRTAGVFSNISTENQLAYPEFGGYRGLYGVTAAEIAPSNSSIIYQMVTDLFFNNRAGGTYIYKSIDGGVTSTVTNYPINTAQEAAGLILLGASQNYKRVNKKIAVDPANPNVVYATNPGAIALVTKDGGTTWTNVPNLPTGTTTTIGACCWQFDTTAGNTGTNVTVVVNGVTVTKWIYVCIQGSGIWQSQDGGVSFQQISSTVGVTDPQYSAMSADGVFYISNMSGTAYSMDRYQSGGWTQVLTIASAPGRSLSIAAHPTVPGVIVGIRTSNQSPHLYYSSNYGASFSTINQSAESYNGTNMDWWVNQVSGFGLASAGMLFDPANPNDLWLCLGQGACKTTLTGSPPSFPGNAPTWTGTSIGIENVVCDDLIHESGTPLLQIVADIVGFVRPTNTLSTVPINPIFGPFIRTSGWSGAIDPANTNNMVVASAANQPTLAFCGYNTVGGTLASWTPFANNPNFGDAAGCTTGGTGGKVLTIGTLTDGQFWPGSNVTASDGTNTLNTTIVAQLTGTPGGSAGATFSLTAAASPGNLTSTTVKNPGNIGAVVPGEIMINNGVILWLSDNAASGIDTTYGSWARSTDWGTTWTIIRNSAIIGLVSGSPATAPIPYGVNIWQGWGSPTAAVPSHTGCADRSDPNTFYIYNGTFIAASAAVTIDATGVTFSGSSLYVNAPISFTSTISLPPNITSGQTYYVLTAPVSNKFTISATPGGTAIDTSGTQSGVITCHTNPIKGIYKSTDGGQTFTYQGTSADPETFGTGIRSLKCVPGTNGHLFAATGYNSGASHPVLSNFFSKSLDGGATWSHVANMFEVSGFGFGKAGPSGNPTLFVAGFYNINGSPTYSDYGIYMSQDLGSTWTKLTSTAFGTWPYRNDAVQCMEGDKDIFGRCYVGFRGSGTVYSTLV